MSDQNFFLGSERIRGQRATAFFLFTKETFIVPGFCLCMPKSVTETRIWCSPGLPSSWWWQRMVFTLGTLLALNSLLCLQAIQVLAVRAGKPVVGCLSLRFLPPLLVHLLHFLFFLLPVLQTGSQRRKL